MSGIVGLVNLDGSPTDRGLLGRMTRSLAPRGPDQQATWADGPAGLGHALLRTTDESEGERQPLTLDGAVWVTADARIDDRAALVDKLAGQGRAASLGRPDAELVLHAYHAWGERCVGHLLGDFAFAVWDGRRRRLFCARDHFGVKPFFYAHVGDRFVFSNTLNCVRLHPDVSDELNDLAIADFLLFGRNQEADTTAFADVRRLPGAHCLTCGEGHWHLRRYWTLPTDGHVRFRRPGEYVERFNELLRVAVEDRLRTSRVAVMMSGGLDSTAVAAVAKEVLSERGRPFDLRAFTMVYDRLIPDQERHYAGLAATALAIPVHYVPQDGYRLYDRWDEPAMRSPEPLHAPLGASGVDFSERVASFSRVALSGLGGDPALLPSPHYFRDLLRGGRFGEAAGELARHLLSRRRLPPLGTGLVARWNRWRGRGWTVPRFPPWLNKEFADRLDLPARWARRYESPSRAPAHPLRPLAYDDLASASWQVRFETDDPGVSAFPLEQRNPFFDVRLVGYLLAIPPLPWCDDKELLRAAMSGRLPDGVRLRPKAPLAGFPEVELVRAGAGEWVDRSDYDSRMRRYVERGAIPRVVGDGDANRVWRNMRPLSLNYWFQHSLRLTKGGTNDDTRSPVRQARC